MRPTPHKNGARLYHPTNGEIAARAREIYLASGSQPGHDLDNWLQAEYELRQLPVRHLANLPPPPRRAPRRCLIRLVQSALL